MIKKATRLQLMLSILIATPFFECFVLLDRKNDNRRIEQRLPTLAELENYKENDLLVLLFETRQIVCFYVNVIRTATEDYDYVFGEITKQMLNNTGDPNAAIIREVMPV